jgi:murein DD-endopeptidase MepM/ murein hydrolase activator NlpD
VLASVRSAAAAPATPPKPGVVHVVKRGETLTAIARRYRVSLAALVAANRLPGVEARIRVGQRLTIPRGRPAARAQPQPRVPVDMVLAIPNLDGLDLPFEWPVEGMIISPFGRRRSGWHKGLDIKADLGRPVLASAPGMVTVSRVEARYGNVIKIQHANDFVTVYAHNLRNFVRVGDRVDAGQVIGQVGRTGRATTYHVHFEIRHADSVYNPLYLLPQPPRLTAIVDTEEEDNDGDE